MMRCQCAILLLLIVALSGIAEVSAQNSPHPTNLGFIKGYSWGWVGRRGEYASPYAAHSMQKLRELGCEWVCISFAAPMAAHDDPNFTWSDQNPQMVTDEEVRTAIALARQHDLKVILKPTVNCRDGIWRAWIRFFRPLTEEEVAQGMTSIDDPWGETPGIRENLTRDEVQWQTWWANYEHFIKHYAAIAAEEHVELYCLGCEMNSMEADETHWRRLIRDVRSVFRGPLIYNVSHGREGEVNWWDALDIIGISAYYPVAPPEGRAVEEAVEQTTSQDEIAAALEQVKLKLAALSARTQRPILFIETGVTSVRGCARYPWSHENARLSSPVDQQEQANFYAAMLEVFWDEPWFLGYAWWDWPAQLYFESDAVDDRSFCVYGKQAERILRVWYAKPVVRP